MIRSIATRVIARIAIERIAPLIGVSLATAVLATPREAIAQAAVTPPKATSSTEVPYPPDGAGDATVTLTLVVEPDGAVSSARAAEDASTFTRAAEEAARSWTFEPALREGVPVASRIRIEVAFRAPAPTDPTPSTRAEPAAPPTTGVAPEGAPPAPRAATPGVDEVNVRGERVEPGRTASLGRAEVRQLPGARSRRCPA